MFLNGSPLVALGLGELRTQSALNQPFYAEIDLFDIDDDALDLVKTSLASRSAFEQAGIERPHFLTQLQFTPMIGPSGEPMVQVISREPVREPYLDLLVEVIWPNGRLVKEYSVLLDPPAVGGSRWARAAPPRAAPAVQSPFVAAAEGGRPQRVEHETVDSSHAQGLNNDVSRFSGLSETSALSSAGAQRRGDAELEVVEVEIPANAAELDFPLRYGPVPSGAGLATIARRMTPPGATLEQTAMALYRNNQVAFINSDINRLRVGAELVIPTAAELFALGPEAARKQYRAALAGRSVVKAPLTDLHARLTIATPETVENATAESELVDREFVEETRLDLDGSELATGADAGLASAVAPERTPEPALRPVAAPVPSAVDAALEAELLLMREASEANRQEANELRARVQELEAQLGDIRRLLELRNAQLASLTADDVGSGSGTAPESTVVQAGSEQDSAPTVADSDVGLKPVGDESGFAFLGMLGALRQALVSWALPLLAVTLLLGLLGLILRRRRQQATAVAVVDSIAVPSQQDGSQARALDDLRLDPEWPIGDDASERRSPAPREALVLEQGLAAPGLSEHGEADQERPKQQQKQQRPEQALDEQLPDLGQIPEQRRLNAETELDGEKLTRIQSALAGKAAESDLSIDDDGHDHDDQQELFLDLDELGEVSDVAPTAMSPAPSQPDHPDALDAPGEDQHPFELELAALDAMANEEQGQAPSPEPESQALSSEAWIASASAADLQWPILASLADEEAVSEGPTDTQSLAQVHAESDLEATVSALPAADQDDIDWSPSDVPAEGATDARWTLETGDGWDEIGLKLDLARAYLDMDDPDAARAILKAVVAEGHDEQRREAEFLLAGMD